MCKQNSLEIKHKNNLTSNQAELSIWDLQLNYYFKKNFERTFCNIIWWILQFSPYKSYLAYQFSMEILNAKSWTGFKLTTFW